MVVNISKIKVLVAMSGGVDSSVATALLVRAGYDVTGMFAVNFDEQKSNGESCWHGDYQDALRVAAKLGLPLLRWDFKKEYRRDVLDYMYREYSAGRTPNPDVLCNKFIKFGAWLDKARQHGFDYIATGHYAQANCHPERSDRVSPKASAVAQGSSCECKLAMSNDKNKDQTYFLHQLNSDQLSHALFPIGKYTKPEVRKLAKKFDLPTAEKEESMGICFVGEVSMRDFLKREIKPTPGDVVLSDDTKVGEHDGLAYYTIGERIAIERQRGFSTTSTKPMFVVEKNIRDNKLIVGFEDNPLLFKSKIAVSEINWVSGHPPKFPLKCKVRLRHRQPLQDCIIVCHSEPKRGISINVNFEVPERAVTPGQFAVFYKKNLCLGGGIIC